MHKLTRLIKDDMKPALGVTEPGAIAFAVAKARSYTRGQLEALKVRMNSGMYKNAFTCGIPNSMEVGNLFSAALGALAGDHKRGLEALAQVDEKDNEKAQELIDQGLVSVELSSISSEIFIEVDYRTDRDDCLLTIVGGHTNIVRVLLNGELVYGDQDIKLEEDQPEEDYLIHEYSLEELYDYVRAVNLEEISFLKQAYEVNMELFHYGLDSPRTTFIKELYRMNGSQVFSQDELKTAQLLCSGAIEARVIGLDRAAMSITGSGAHGLIATLPLNAVYKVRELSEEKLLRATLLSYLITTYIKEYSGKLSAFCGCAIAAGTGMACGLVYLKGGGIKEMSATINNMASSITGMICDGGNQGCTMKGVVAVDAGFRSVDFALAGVAIDSVHGINGASPEETMRNMGLIASPGMVGTEKTIVEIFEDKLK